MIFTDIAIQIDGIKILFAGCQNIVEVVLIRIKVQDLRVELGLFKNQQHARSELVRLAKEQRPVRTAQD